MERSWLWNPGSVTWSLLQVFPMSRCPVGRENASVLNHRLIVRSPRDSLGSPVMFGNEPLLFPQRSPPPVKSKLSVAANVIVPTPPVANVLMPDRLQLSSSSREAALLPSFDPTRGRSIV